MGKQLTYQELLAAYNKLLMENEYLHKEVDRLQSLLSSKGASSTLPAMKQHLSLEEKVDVFRNLFKGREDVFARRWYSRTSGKSGYQPVCRNEWDRQLCDKKKYKCTECPNRSFKPLEYEDIYRHLEGKSPEGQDVIGAYAIFADNTCNFLCADFDDKSCEHGYRKDVLAYVGVCKDWTVPQKISYNDFPSNPVLIRSNMLYIPLQGFSAKVVNHLKRIASFKNPEFYARQGMRLSTYNIPRIISCADMEEDYIALPRGCEDAIVTLLENNKVAYRMEDKTHHGENIAVEFKGKLREEQRAAIASLTAHENGILNATTAFGKTVTAIGLIAEQKVNTLILVHTKALLDQWKSRLEEFLQIDFTEDDLPKKRGSKRVFSPFGTLDSKGNFLHGKIDIALMQSCLEDSGVKPFVRDYGMLIVDECHHVSAVNFERILKYANARYVYGLTATSIRKDGHQPIIFMQCGPIRYSADAKKQMASQAFTRLLVPRFTSYRELTDDKFTYSTMIQKMAEDENRNRLITDDVCEALKEGRSPIVLTSLTAHVETLANVLTPHCKNVVTLVGSESAKEKRQKMEYLQNIPPSEPLVIVATGKYVGEGFDYPRLDTLFLALPVSWKGIIAQYAGRLHREYPGKKEVWIYDYIDIRVPMCNVMYKRRLKGYSSVGYQIKSNAPMDLFNESHSVIFNGHTYQSEFFKDLFQAKRSVVISATKLWFAKHSPVLDILKDLLVRGVEVVTVIKSNQEKEEQLKGTGASIRVNDSLAIDVAIIDKSLIWYGSVNYLGYNTDENNAIRIYDSTLAENIIEVLYTYT